MRWSFTAETLKWKCRHLQGQLQAKTSLKAVHEVVVGSTSPNLSLSNPKVQIGASRRKTPWTPRIVFNRPRNHSTLALIVYSRRNHKETPVRLLRQPLPHKFTRKELATLWTSLWAAGMSRHHLCSLKDCIDIDINRCLNVHLRFCICIIIYLHINLALTAPIAKHSKKQTKHCICITKGEEKCIEGRQHNLWYLCTKGAFIAAAKKDIL